MSKDLLNPAPAPVGKLRTVTRAVWALPFVKKLVILGIITALGAAGVKVSPEVASGLVIVAETVAEAV